MCGCCAERRTQRITRLQFAQQAMPLRSLAQLPQPATRPGVVFWLCNRRCVG